jgi:tight adherence protein B
VVVAAQLQHDVAGAMREVARAPGAEGLSDVAAAWEVSARSGSGLAGSLDQVAQLLAARQRRSRLVASELAAARATALVVSGLPLLVLAMGSGIGTNPWDFFLTSAGSADLAVAGALLFAGWAWLNRLATQADRR